MRQTLSVIKISFEHFNGPWDSLVNSALSDKSKEHFIAACRMSRPPTQLSHAHANPWISSMDPCQIYFKTHLYAQTHCTVSSILSTHVINTTKFRRRFSFTRQTVSRKISSSFSQSDKASKLFVIDFVRKTIHSSSRKISEPSKTQRYSSNHKLWRLLFQRPSPGEKIENLLQLKRQNKTLTIIRSQVSKASPTHTETAAILNIAFISLIYIPRDTGV